MSEPAKPIRRWLRMHLFTCVILVMVAGLQLGLNQVPYSTRISRLYDVSYGWPMTHYRSGMRVNFLDYDPGEPPYFSTDTYEGWNPTALAANIVINLLILFCVALACEFRLISAILARRLIPSLLSVRHKKNLWQIHLSTTVLCMFAAGVILWSNCHDWAPSPNYYWNEYGWPCTAYRVGPLDVRQWSSRQLFADIVVALLVVSIVTLVSEYLIRRREAKKP